MKYQLTANRLRNILLEKHMKAQDLADKSGINKSSISQYVNGSHKPSNIAANKMADVLDINPLWLMGFDIEKEPLQIPDAVAGTGELLDLYFKATDEQRSAVINLLRSFVN